jgi:hypothetical protein
MTAAAGPHDPRLGTPQHYRWLHAIVKLVIALNLLDAIFTLAWVNAGLAREANPLLASLVREHPVLFSLVKLGLVAMGSLLLWHYRNRAVAVIGIFVAFLSYYLVVLYHIGFLSLIVGTMLFP